MTEPSRPEMGLKKNCGWNAGLFLQDHSSQGSKGVHVCGTSRKSNLKPVELFSQQQKQHRVLSLVPNENKHQNVCY